jgi:hypothetical protein
MNIGLWHPQHVLPLPNLKFVATGVTVAFSIASNTSPYNIRRCASHSLIIDMEKRHFVLNLSEV